jgi:hypothetical protein
MTLGSLLLDRETFLRSAKRASEYSMALTPVLGHEHEAQRLQGKERRAVTQACRTRTHGLPCVRVQHVVRCGRTTPPPSSQARA